MTSENQKHESVSSDSSYGGSTYRLSYDHKEIKKSRAKRSFGVLATVAIVISVVLLVVSAYFALRHYNKAIQKLYASETVSDDGRYAADFKSSVTVVKD